MNTILLELPYTDQNTKIILQELLDKKNNIKKTLTKLQISYSLLFANAFALIMYSHYVLRALHRQSVFEQVQLLINNSTNRTLVFIIIAIGSLVLVLQRKYEDQEQEYETLRFEVIDQISDYWQNNDWENRHIVFNILKKKFDINLFFKT